MEKENNQKQDPEEKKEPEQNKEQSSVENLLKNFDEKIKGMQAEFNKKLADKDEIIKQLVMQSGKKDPELTDDEKSCQTIIANINKRR